MRFNLFHMIQLRSILFPCLLLFVFGSCIRSNVYEKNVSIPFNQWHSTDKQSFDFRISDTSATYQLYFTMRHTDAYPFANLWLNVRSNLPGESGDSAVKIEIPLAQADGKWLGRGMNEIWEHRMPLSRSGKAIKFNRSGNYHIELQQIMRSDPLPEVMSVGIRLEKNPS